MSLFIYSVMLTCQKFKLWQEFNFTQFQILQKWKKKLKSISTLKNQIKKTNLRFRYIKDSGI